MSQHRTAILLVHGFYSDVSACHYLARLLSSEYLVYSIDLNLTYDSLDNCIQQLKNKTDHILIQTRATRLCFVGHSSGGLVIRGLMNFYPELAGHTLAVVMVAVPNRGTALADVHESVLPEALRIHRPIQSLTRAANAASNWSPPEHLLTVGFAGIQSWPQTQEFFAGLNDGIVAASSVRLDEMEDLRLLPYDHLQIWRSFPLAKAVIYVLQKLRLPPTLYRLNLMTLEEKFRRIHAGHAIDELITQARANIEAPTLGGRTFWEDLIELDGWRLQRNHFTSHVRLLNPSNIRKAWSNTKRMHEMMDFVLSKLQADAFSTQKQGLTDDPIVLRLKRLQSLYQSGLITELEFKSKRESLLSEL